MGRSASIGALCARLPAVILVARSQVAHLWNCRAKPPPRIGACSRAAPWCRRADHRRAQEARHAIWRGISLAGGGKITSTTFSHRLAAASGDADKPLSRDHSQHARRERFRFAFRQSLHLTRFCWRWPMIRPGGGGDGARNRPRIGATRGGARAERETAGRDRRSGDSHSIPPERRRVESYQRLSFAGFSRQRRSRPTRSASA